MNHTSRMGMQPWMAPEILLAPSSTAHYDHTCDIYSSATVLFCLGSGRPPPRISPSAPQKRGDLGLLDWPELASIIERMWEHDPAYRSVRHPSIDFDHRAQAGARTRLQARAPSIDRFHRMACLLTGACDAVANTKQPPAAFQNQCKGCGREAHSIARCQGSHRVAHARPALRWPRRPLCHCMMHTDDVGQIQSYPLLLSSISPAFKYVIPRDLYTVYQ